MVIKVMKLLLFILLGLFAYVESTSVVRSVVMYTTSASFKGRLLGTNTTTNANCTSIKPSICTSSGAFSLLARSDLNLANIPINGTVPVIWFSNNLTMASTYAALWSLAQGTSWYIQTAVSNITGVSGSNATYWTLASETGAYIDAQSSCGGNGSMNFTGNVGLAGTNNALWMNSTQLSCELSRQFLCVCESYATPITVSSNVGNDTPAVIGGVIGAIVGIALIFALAFYVPAMVNGGGSMGSIAVDEEKALTGVKSN